MILSLLLSLLSSLSANAAEPTLSSRWFSGREPMLRVLAGFAMVKRTYNPGEDFQEWNDIKVRSTLHHRAYGGVGCLVFPSLSVNLLGGGLTGLELEWMAKEPSRKPGSVFAGVSAGYMHFLRGPGYRQWDLHLAGELGLTVLKSTALFFSYRTTPLAPTSRALAGVTGGIQFFL